MTIGFRFAASLADLAEEVTEAGGAWVRSAWHSDDGDTWRLRMLEIVIGTMPHSFASARWLYPRADLIASEEPGQRVSAWFRNGYFDAADHLEPIGESVGRVNWQRRESQARTGYERLAWPSYEAQFGNLQTNEPQQPLLSDTDAPSFASFQRAAAWFFGLDAAPPGNSVPTFAALRWEDRRARINRVEITEDAMRVEVEGEALDGLVVELAGDAPGPVEVLETPDSTVEVTFPLPDGLPSGAWVVVRSGSEWLDRRFLAWPWAHGQEPGVTIEVAPKTRIDAFIAARESDSVEFKERIPEQDSTRASVMKTVCAFANGSGGSLLFGITDDYEVLGVPRAKANRYVDLLSELVDAWIDPIPTYSFEILPVDGTHTAIIELVVGAGPTLFGSSKPNEPRRVYVRHHSRSVPARVHEIERLVRSRTVSGRLYPR